MSTESTRLKNTKILLVDDEAGILEYMKEEFEFEGANVITAPNGEEAIKFTLIQKFDAIITDMRMANGSGIELMKAVSSKLGANTPAIFITTGFTDTTIEESYFFGAQGSFTKPISLSDLIDSVARSVLSPADRYRWPTSAEDSRLEQIIQEIELQSIQDNSSVLVGRGGIALAVLEKPMRIGQKLKILLGDQKNPMIFQVRWARRDAKENFKPGYGLELLCAHPKALEEFLKASSGSSVVNAGCWIPSFSEFSK